MIRANEEREPQGVFIPEEKASEAGVSDHEAQLLDDQGILPRHTPLSEINPTLAKSVSPVINQPVIKSEIGEGAPSVSQSPLDSKSGNGVGHGTVDGLTPIGFADDGTGRPIYPSLNSSVTQERLEGSGVLFAPAKRQPPKKIAHRRPRER